MPQFVPPPLMQEDEDAPAPLSRDAERFAQYEKETLRPMADMIKIRKLARSGTIPDSLRGSYWMILLEYLPLNAEERPARRARALHEYQTLVKEVLKDFGDFSLPNADDPRRIDIDIPRTLPTLHFYASYEATAGTPTSPGEKAPRFTDNAGPGFNTSMQPFTRNQQSLRRILHLFARLNAGAGYVQGMNELVGHMLYAFCGGKGFATPQIEADVFFSFQKLHQFVGDNFQRELDMDANGIKGTLSAYDTLLRKCDPEIHTKLAEVGLLPEFYAFRWLTLMFSQDFYTPDVLSVWDFLLSFGDEIDAAVMYAAVAMVSLVREQLFAMPFGGCIQLLQSYPHHEVDVIQIKNLTEFLIRKHGIQTARQGRSVGSRSTSPAAEPESRVTATVRTVGRAAQAASSSFKNWLGSWQRSKTPPHESQ